jgi:hypothetical protein
MKHVYCHCNNLDHSPTSQEVGDPYYYNASPLILQEDNTTLLLQHLLPLPATLSLPLRLLLILLHFSLQAATTDA